MVKLTIENISGKLGKRIELDTKELSLTSLQLEDSDSLASLKELEELDLSGNWFRFFRQIEGILEAPRLKKLLFVGNDVTKIADYRLFIISNCPLLEELDGEKITEEEKIQAHQWKQKKNELEREMEMANIKQSNVVVWEKDEDVQACRKCTQIFTTFRRRHHCRACGKIFCGDCSQNKGAKDFEFVRLCDDCYQNSQDINEIEFLTNEIWIQHGFVTYWGLTFLTRMVIVKLNEENDLFIYSPLPLIENRKKRIVSLGTIKYVVSPSRLHCGFVDDWIAQFPDAQFITTSGTQEWIKQHDKKYLPFTNILEDDLFLPDKLRPIFDMTILRGNDSLNEVIFFHKSSQTIICADFIYNFQDHSKGLSSGTKTLARFSGRWNKPSPSPDFRLFGFYKQDLIAARESLKKILSWNPEKIILAHGENLQGGAKTAIEIAYDWVLKEQPISNQN